MIRAVHRITFRSHKQIFHSLRNCHNLLDQTKVDQAAVDAWHSKVIDVYKNGCEKIDQVGRFLSKAEQFLEENSSRICSDRDSVKERYAECNSLIKKCYAQLEELDTCTAPMLELCHNYPHEIKPTYIGTDLIPLMKSTDKVKEYIGGCLLSLSLHSFETSEVDETTS